MRNVLVATAVLVTLALGASSLVACGGGGGGGAPPPGQAVLLDVPVKWLDANFDGLFNPGDELSFWFDRFIDPGANLPQADLAIVNGVVGGGSAWIDDGTSNLRMSAGAGAVMTPGLLPGTTRLNLIAANTLVNPTDGSTPALPATMNQSIMANVSNSGQNFGGTTSYDVYLHDFDDVISLDLAFARSGPNRLYFNPGNDGNFTEGAPWIGEVTGGANTYGLALITQAGGPPVDFIVTGNGLGATMANYVYLVPAGGSPIPDHRNTTQGGWYLPLDTPYVELGNEDTRGIEAAFFDADLNMDLVCANRGAQNVIYFGRGDGLFDGNGTLPGVQDPHWFGDVGPLPGGDTRAVAVGQLNGALSVDIAFVEGDEGGRFVPWFVNAGGIPAQGTKRTGLGDVQEVALYDLDNDGDLDALVGRGANGGIVILRNDGAGLFTQVGGVLGSNSVWGIACADLNGDGALDIISGNTNNQDNVIWLCNDLAALTYQSSGLSFGGQNTWGVAASFNGLGVDGVGVDDFATAETSGGSILWWTGR